jgi:acyl carrier protein
VDGQEKEAMIVDTNNAKIRKFLSRFFRKHEIGDHEDIFELGVINSLFAMQLVLYLEKEFEITVDTSDVDLDNFRTIEKIVQFVEKKREMTA